MMSQLKHLRSWLLIPHWSVGLSLARIMLGTTVVMIYLLHIRDRMFLWGPHGDVPIERYHHDFAMFGVNLFGMVGSSRAAFDAVFITGFVVAVLYTLGFGSRVMSVLFALTTWSLLHRNPFIMDGGLRLLGIASIYLAFADVTAYFSLDRRIFEQRPAFWLDTMITNTSAMLVIFQICIIYAFSAFYKITGPDWQNGTAIYYALADPQFNISPLNALVLGSPLLITFGTYATLLYQISFPWMLLHPSLKYAAVALGILFHCSIAVSMGLYWFSSVMIGCEAIILTDRDYARMISWFDTLRRRRPDDSTFATPQEGF